MGYVNNTQMSTFIPPSMIQKTLGTWTPTIANNLVSDVRTAADASFTLIVPIPLLSNAAVKAGAKLKSIDLYYKITVGACDDIASVALDKVSLKADAVALTGATVAITIGAANDTGVKRKTVADHTLTVTLDAPAYIDNDELYALSMVVDCAANTVFALFGARANYELRL